MSDDADWRAMLAARTPDMEPDPFSLAVMGYRAKFGAAALPHLLDVDEEVAARVLAQAVARGRPLRHGYTVSRLSGGWRNTPPRGVFI